MARDDFSKSVIRELEQRVGSRCSNPDCAALTRGPKGATAGVVSVGVAAHITAAAEGGPRYNKTLSSEQRRAAENGIWLCQTCSRLIDVDDACFSVSLLQMWKSDAEARALAALGKTSHELNTRLSTQLRELKSNTADRSRQFVERALRTLEGFGAAFPTAELAPDGGGVGFVWRTGVQPVDLMLVDLPGGIWSDRISVVLTSGGQLRLRVYDADGGKHVANTVGFGANVTLACYVKWDSSSVGMWVNGELGARVETGSPPLSTAPLQGLLGIDLDGDLSAENVRKSYVVENRRGLNLERHGIWEGNHVSELNVSAAAITDEQASILTTLTYEQCRGRREDPMRTLSLFLEDFEALGQAVTDWKSGRPAREVAASRVRNFLLGGEPSVSAVVEILAAAGWDKTLLFDGGRPSIPLPEQDLAFAWRNPQSLDDKSAPSLTLEEFLASKNLFVGKRWFTNEDVLRVITQALERGRVSEDDAPVLASTLYIGGDLFGMQHLKAIVDVAIAALQPLADFTRELFAGPSK